MLQSRWHLVIVSFLAGVLVCLFLAYALSDSARPQTVIEVSQSTPKNKPAKGTILKVVSPPKLNPPEKKPDSKVLKQIPTYADRLASSSYTEVEDAYYNRLLGVHVKCSSTPHVGRAGDGGWEVCMAPGFKPKKPCLIYSFGVNNIWEFDEIMARDYGCVVRAFDPSMAANDHVHQPGPVNFYKLGLGGADTTRSNGWKILTFQSMLKKHNEADRTLDLVKMDIEYSEWESFESILKDGILKRTKQLLFETHTNDVNGAIPTKETFLRYHKVLDGIEALGFRRFFRHDNPFGVGAVASTRGKSSDPVYKKSAQLRRTCCNELYYVNLNLVKDTTGLTPVESSTKPK